MEAPSSVAQEILGHSDMRNDAGYVHVRASWPGPLLRVWPGPATEGQYTLLNTLDLQGAMRKAPRTPAFAEVNGAFRCRAA